MEVRQKFLENFGVAVFTDFGNTLFGAENLKWENIAVAIGFGLRYYSEIVPIRLDFGFKFYDPENPKNFFAKIKDDASYLLNSMQFHLGIGEAF